ncbi:DUF3533 domain-containing protein [Streptomyces sp. NPDC058308]|uniref:DUF3533 domain-containing protein n=1 Tax=Streptomyces sp. NPDC058308 TaxID=3346440 RepID=UPI0036F0BE45
MHPSSPHPQRVSSALHLLRGPKVWLVPCLLLTVALCVIAVVFNGSVANPNADLRDAPVGLVNLDQGAMAGESTQNLGDQALTGITSQPQHPRQIKWETLSSLDEAKTRIGRNELFAAVVLPKDYSAKMLGLAGPEPAKPAVTVLTNHGGGSMAASIGQNAGQKAAIGASKAVGQFILQQTQKAGQPVPHANRALLLDPVTVVEQPGSPLGERTGMGMTAFFYALLLMMAGFLGANLINAMTDAELGFSASEFGPKRHTALPQPINRSQTLLAKSLIMAATAAVVSAGVLAVSTFALDLDLPHSAQLWLFGTAAISAVGIGTLCVLAVLGAPGIVVAMLVFVAAAIPTSGGAIPLHAMPPFWKFLASFEPQRALCDGVRAIMYFDAQSSAGLGRAWTVLGVGLAITVLIGFLVTWFYGHKGLHRIHPHALERLRAFLHHDDKETPTGIDAAGQHPAPASTSTPGPA